MDDSISRQAAIDELYSINPTESDYIFIDEAVQRLENLPPAERKKGRWVDVTDGIRVWKVCDQCGEKPLWNEWKTDRDLSSFCPKCGAEMRGAEE